MLLNRWGQENVQMQKIGTDIGSHYFGPYINQQERRIQNKQNQETQQQKHTHAHTFWSIGQADIIHLVGIRTHFFHTQILAIGSWSSPPEILQAWRPFFEPRNGKMRTWNRLKSMEKGKFCYLILFRGILMLVLWMVLQIWIRISSVCVLM